MLTDVQASRLLLATLIQVVVRAQVRAFADFLAMKTDALRDVQISESSGSVLKG